MKSPLPPVNALEGIRVLELGQLIAGPFAAKILGEFGADVIKVESPTSGDPLRKWRMLHADNSVWWEVNHETRSQSRLIYDNLKRKTSFGSLLRIVMCSSKTFAPHPRGLGLRLGGVKHHQPKANYVARVRIRTNGSL